MHVVVEEPRDITLPSPTSRRQAASEYNTIHDNIQCTLSMRFATLHVDQRTAATIDVHPIFSRVPPDEADTARIHAVEARGTLDGVPSATGTMKRLSSGTCWQQATGLSRVKDCRNHQRWRAIGTRRHQVVMHLFAESGECWGIGRGGIRW